MTNTMEKLVYKLNHRQSQMLLTKILDGKICEDCGKESNPMINGNCVHCYNLKFERK